MKPGLIATLLAALRPGPRAIIQAHATIQRRQHARASCGWGTDPVCRAHADPCVDCPHATPGVAQ